MPRYTSPGYRSVIAHDIDEAAHIFAARHARRLYGRRAYVRTYRVDAWSPDRSSITVECFVGVDRIELFDCHGRPSGPSVCVGSDVSLHISTI